MEGPSRTELESKITFLEGTVDALNEVILGQGRQLEHLERRLLRFEERLASVEADGDEHDPLEERPPHY